MANDVCLQKLLHFLIDRFIGAYEEFINDSQINRNKIDLELVKRSSEISGAIRNVALGLLSSYHYPESSIPEAVLEEKIDILMELILRQDLVECALNADTVLLDVYPTYDDLHNMLFLCATKSTSTSIVSQNFNFGSFFAPAGQFDQGGENLSLPSLSNQFKKECIEFKTDLCHLRCILESESPVSDLKSSEVSPKGDSVQMEDNRNGKSINYADEPCTDWLAISQDKARDLLCPYERFSSMLGWESRMKQNVACHLYTTELAGREVEFNVTPQDSDIFRSLHSKSKLVSEVQIARDILSMLIGIPSATFLYDETKNSFQIKNGVHLLNLSPESTSRFCDNFMESGSAFRKLKLFCSSSSTGLMLKGLKNGVNAILSVYTEYIVSVKVTNPALDVLRREIWENSELLNILGTICDPYLEGKESPSSISLPKGLGLLSHLNQYFWGHNNRGNATVLAILLKYAYAPYFSFLNKWFAEGICIDPYNEFEIIEDTKYLKRKDELYWKFAYIENEEDEMRRTPPELSKYAQDILQCGKNMRLLQNCCPNLPSLEYMYSHPPPLLSMAFSYQAINQKKEECESYVRNKELEEKEFFPKKLSEENFHLQKQTLVDERLVSKLVKKKWNLLCCFDKKDNCNEEEMKSSSLRKCNSFPNLHPSDENPDFSGRVFSDAGILMSSCGFNHSTGSDDSIESTIQKQKICHLKLDAFSQQLNLNSYFHAVPYDIDSYPQDGQSYTSTKDSTKRVGNDKCAETVEESTTIQNSVPKDSFLDSLLSLLVSEYGDSKEEIYSCIQLASLQSLMLRNFSMVLSMRMHLVQTTMMDYVMKNLKLQDLLLCLRNLYFLQDEYFSQHLCKRLFKWVSNCSTLQQFTDWSKLNEILCRAVEVPSFSGVPFVESASALTVALPLKHPTKKHEFLQYFQFEFQIPWPLNVIVHKACITQYTSIFSFILKMEYLCWLLGRVWRTLILNAKRDGRENCPQYRQVMLNRFDMHQFVRVLRNCIHQDLGGPLWDSLSKGLNTKELSVNALEKIHIKYLEKALARCFLTDELNNVSKILEMLFQQVYKFCSSAQRSSWKQDSGNNNQFVCSNYEDLTGSYTRYTQCKVAFYECMLQKRRRERHSREWDEDYHIFLEIILETGRNL